MGTFCGPQLSQENLLFTYQPGQENKFTKNNEITFASDVQTPVCKEAVGPRRTRDAGFGDVYADTYSDNIDKGPVMEFKNQNAYASPLYNLSDYSTYYYTVSVWVNMVSFPTEYKEETIQRDHTHVTKTKRAALCRFNYRTGVTSGFIEFGAMGPYYLDSSNNKTYKSVFEPISFGASISPQAGGKTNSVYTDYKFYLNTWYLLTLELNFIGDWLHNINIISKFFVNGVQENVAVFEGTAWSQRNRHLANRKRRYAGYVAAQPGFVNRATGSAISNAQSQTLPIKLFFDIRNLNYVSFSPNKTFQWGTVMDDQGNYNDGNNAPRLYSIAEGRGEPVYQVGTGINFGQVYIYNDKFDAYLYDQFCYLYR
jgi:hypothetical protein